MIVATAFVRQTDLENSTVGKRAGIDNWLAAIRISDSAVRKSGHDKRKRYNGKHCEAGTAHMPAPAYPRQTEHPAYESFSIHACFLASGVAKGYATNLTYSTILLPVRASILPRIHARLQYNIFLTAGCFDTGQSGGDLL